MSNKHPHAAGKGSSNPSPLVKQTRIFTAYSAGYKPLYDLLLMSVRESKLDESQVTALPFHFADMAPQTPQGFRSAPWYQAQRQKFAFFREQLSKLAAQQVGIFVDVDVQFFPNLHILERLLETMRTRQIDLMLMAENGGPVVNPGFILAANTQAARTFMERVSVTLGEFGKPLHPPQTITTEGEAGPVVNRLLQRTPRQELKWDIIAAEHTIFGPDIQRVRWANVIAHHATCSSGAPAKMDQMGGLRHLYYNWKHAEAVGFPTPIPADPLVVMPRVPGGVWIAKSNNKLYLRDDGGIETRNPSVVKLVTAANEKHPDIPDFKPIYVCTQDTPATRVPGSTILAFSIDKRHPNTQFGQEVIAVPDNVFDHWRNAGMPDYEETCAQLHAASKKTPHKNLAGWIGNAHMHQTRVKLLEMAHKHPAELEAINTGVWKQVPNLPRFEVGQGRYYSLPEQVEMYAFLLDVEGNGWSGRLKLLLHAGRPLLIQERPWEEFYFSKLKPMEHYVPVASDMSDLVKQVQWLQANPEEADRIARNAQNFAKEHLCRAAAIEAWAQALRKLST